MKVAENQTRLKKVTTILLIALPIILVAGCDQRSTTYVTGEDHTPPPVPTGVNTITGDGTVWVQWDAIIGIPDLAGYKVWRSIDNYEFFRIATVGRDAIEYEDNDVVNGRTYYYGVSSFDNDGNESDASFNYSDAFDTPRPEAFDEVLFDFNEVGHADSSGFDFSSEQHVFYDSYRCDVFLEYDDTLVIPAFFIWLGDNGRFIQDMGYTDSFDDITYAPDTGWSLYDYFEAIEGHTYVIQTWDDHFAKIRVTFLDEAPVRLMIFDWGYQIDPGNRELKIDPRAIEVAGGNDGGAQ